MYVHLLFSAPSGLHVVVMGGYKILRVFRVSELSSPIGSYSIYADIERVIFSADSQYLILALADRRLFFLLICDFKVKGHRKKAQVCLLKITYNKFMKCALLLYDEILYNFLHSKR